MGVVCVRLARLWALWRLIGLTTLFFPVACSVDIQLAEHLSNRCPISMRFHVAGVVRNVDVWRPHSTKRHAWEAAPARLAPSGRHLVFPGSDLASHFVSGLFSLGSPVLTRTAQAM